MNIKKHIPNFLTLCNLLCGCLGVFVVLKFQDDIGYLVTAILLLSSLIFDFLDGFVARALKVTSPIGKELDSLADMVTFGLLPGLIMFVLFNKIDQGSFAFTCQQHDTYYVLAPIPFIAFIIPLFSALRLAKFNVDTRQSHDFYGVPTPANALLIMSLPMIMIYDQFGIAQDIFTVPVLVGITIVSSLLLVAPIRLMAFKFKDYTWKNNKFKYIHLVLFVIFVVTLKFYAIPLTIVVYILLSLLRNLLEKNEVQS